MSAGVALRQLRLALAGNVWYLDDGWQTLVDGLRDLGLEHGARIQTGACVRAVRSGDGRVSVALADGAEIEARAVVVAVDPSAACQLLGAGPASAVKQWAADCVPVRVACLDLALERVPRPAQRFALGLDQPVYFSVHSAAARLAPGGISVIHMMKYLDDDVSAAVAGAEGELEGVLDLIQPGWKSLVLARRFLPRMTVAPVSRLRGRQVSRAGRAWCKLSFRAFSSRATGSDPTACWLTLRRRARLKRRVAFWRACRGIRTDDLHGGALHATA